jgi:regulation of enolase protein 1 (concanavalin A-like superfamily)
MASDVASMNTGFHSANGHARTDNGDGDGRQLSIVAVGAPNQGGSVILNDNGTPGDTTDDFISYTPAAGFVGTETFTYDLSDGQLISQATVTVTVDPVVVNGAPAAANDAFNVDQDSVANLLDVKANDSDPDDDALSIVAVGTPDQGGTVVLNDNGTAGDTTDDFITYTPVAGFTGTEIFTYDLSDGQLTSQAMVTITVSGGGAISPSGLVSDPFSGTGLNTNVWNVFDPLGDSTVSMTGNEQLSIAVPAGVAHDLWKNALFAPRVRQAANNTDFELEVKFDSALGARYQIQGLTVEQDATNLLRFDFNSDGSVVRIYSASFLNGNPTKRIEVTITAGVPLYLRVTRVGNVWTQAYSYDGANWITAGSYSHSLTVTAVGLFAGNAGSPPPAHAALIDYFMVDGIQPWVSNTAPIAVNDSFSVDQDTTSNMLDVKANDSDPEGDALSVVAVSAPDQGGSAALNDNGTPGDTTDDFISYTPAAGFTGTEIFTYDLSDGDLTSQATVIVAVEPMVIGAVPVARDDIFEVGLGSIDNALDVMLNDISSAGNQLSISSLGIPDQGGFLSVNDNGTPADTSDDYVDYTPAAGFTGIEEFTYDITDGVFTSQATATVTVTGSNSPVIQIWYGKNQSFGSIGQPQKWVNILGNVADPDGIASVYYSLNGAAELPLTLGPSNRRRLQSPGDFNIELAYTDLQPGVNSILITATDSLGNQATESVTLSYPGVNVWPRTYATNWASAARISDQAQVVDGRWALEGSTVRPLELGYDRLIAIGDISWDSYEITVPITAHGIDPICPLGCDSNPGVGVLLRWSGHYDWDGAQPTWGWHPIGALGWFRWNKSDVTSNQLNLLGSGGLTEAEHPQSFGSLASKSMPFGVPHIFKLRAETTGGTRIYSIKMWREDQAEPAQWDITGSEDLTKPGSGSILFVAHHVDASFGDVSIVPLGVDTTAPTISNIQAAVTADTATISWVTDEPANSGVAYGNTSAYENGTVTDGFYRNTHSVTLTDLQADTEYHYQVSSADASGNTSYSADLTFVTSDLANPAGVRSDQFNSGSLDTDIWTYIDPRGDSSISLTGSQLAISVPAGTSHDAWSGGNFAPRIMQPVSNADFEIEAKFDSAVTQRFQLQGILVEQDAGNYIRFNFQHDGSNTRIFAATLTNNSPTTRVDTIIPDGAPRYLRIKRAGNQWTQYYSVDGVNWTTAVVFTHALTVSSVGVFAGNAGSPPPDFTALIDYFVFNSLVGDQVPPVISNISVDVTDTLALIKWQTNKESDRHVDYGLTDAYEIGSVESTAQSLTHAITLEELAPGSLYHFRVRARDANGNTTESGDLTFTTEAGETGPRGGIYRSDTDITYKEYWVSHDEFTGGCGEHEVSPPSFYFEPSSGCTKSVTLQIPDDFTQALKAEIYVDLWRNRNNPSARFTINGGTTIYNPRVGSDWSRTPYVGRILKSELVQGANTLTFTGVAGQYHVHDIAVRIYYDNEHPLIAGPGSDVTPPTGQLTSVVASNGTFLPGSGGVLNVDSNQLTLNATANGAQYVEFHGYYYGYDENNDAEFIDWHNLKRNSRNPGSNGTINHIGTDSGSPYSVTWNLPHIPSQSGVRFKVRLVDAAGNVREAAGNASAEFTLSRSQLVETYLIHKFVDGILHHAGTEPTVITRTIHLPADLSDVTGAYLTGAFWRNPFITINPANGNAPFAAFATGEDSWALSIRQIPVNQLVPGANVIQYTYLGTGFGEFIEKPGPMITLIRSRPGAPETGFVPDEFNGAGIDTSIWTFMNPVGDGVLAMTGTQASLSVPAGTAHDIWSNGNAAPRIMQPAADTDMGIEVKFDSAVTQSVEGQGILIEEDINEFLRFEFTSNGANTRFLIVRFQDGDPLTLHNAIVNVTSPAWMRIRRDGDQWTAFYSTNGVDWIQTHSFSHQMSVRSVGLHVTNSGTSPQQTALIDYFRDFLPVITLQPSNLTVLEGEDAIFSVAATGAAPLSYQWQRDGVAIPGATDASYTLETASLADDGATFNVVVTNGDNVSVTSDLVSLSVLSAARTTQGLQALYTFEEGAGTTVTDFSGVGAPLNLTIGSPGAVTWIPGALSINSSALINSGGPATKIISAAQTANALTVEAWVKPANTTQSGPARIVSLSPDLFNRDMTLGQSGNSYDMRLRTTGSSDNGVPSIITPAGTATTDLTHVVYTWDTAGTARFYVNGVEAITAPAGGNLSNWNPAYALNLANEATGDRPWLGELHLVAIYNRALSAAEVGHHFTVGSDSNAPLAVDDAFIVGQDSIDNVLDVKANDSDPNGDVLSLVAVSTPDQGGTVVLNDNGTPGDTTDDFISYTPAAGFTGTELFTYDLSDGQLVSQATVTVTVDPAINNAPIAGDDAFTVDQDSTVNVLDVKANDSDPNGDALSVVAVGIPDQGGSVVLNEQWHPVRCHG